MAVTAEQPAPYVSPGVFIPLLERNREKGLPNPLTAESLQRLGVPDSLVPRTLQAFKTLDLIAEDGRHLDILESFRRAPEAEYRPMMAAWLNDSYSHALDVIDPATADETAIRDAFRHYNPISMQPRMITLFIALYEVAGVRQGAVKASAKKPASNGAVARVARPAPRPPTRQPDRPPIPPSSPAVQGLHPALAGLLASLPSPERGWTKDDRDRFLAAFAVVLDFAIPPGVIKHVATPGDTNAEEAS